MSFTGISAYEMLICLGNWSRFKNLIDFAVWNMSLSDWQELSSDLEVLANNFLAIIRIQGFG